MKSTVARGQGPGSPSGLDRPTPGAPSRGDMTLKHGAAGSPAPCETSGAWKRPPPNSPLGQARVELHSSSPLSPNRIRRPVRSARSAAPTVACAASVRRWLQCSLGDGDIGELAELRRTERIGDVLGERCHPVAERLALRTAGGINVGDADMYAMRNPATSGQAARNACERDGAASRQGRDRPARRLRGEGAAPTQKQRCDCTLWRRGRGA